MDWDKIDIIHYLSMLRGYRTYLEICTATTGRQFAKINRSRFDVCHRLMYRCADDYSDGMEINFRSSDLDIGRCLEEIEQGGIRYDIILVDPFHDYASSLRDLKVALGLLTDRGSLVVHDCYPPSDDIIGPEFVPGSWCGVTFIAYLDFVMDNKELGYCTVDTDYGCGVIWRSDLPGANRAAAFREQWQQAKHNPADAFRFMRQFSFSFCHLRAVSDFIRDEAERAVTR